MKTNMEKLEARLNETAQSGVAALKDEKVMAIIRSMVLERMVKMCVNESIISQNKPSRN